MVSMTVVKSNTESAYPFFKKYLLFSNEIRGIRAPDKITPGYRPNTPTQTKFITKTRHKRFRKRAISFYRETSRFKRARNYEPGIPEIERVQKNRQGGRCRELLYSKMYSAKTYQTDSVYLNSCNHSLFFRRLLSVWRFIPKRFAAIPWLFLESFIASLIMYSSISSIVGKCPNSAFSGFSPSPV